jgi:alpha-galactosidase
MIVEIQNSYVLSTNHTTYAFQVTDTGHLEHLYYGRKISLPGKRELEAICEKNVFASGNTNVYDDEHKNFSLENLSLEMSSYGKGDIREPFIEIMHADGAKTSDFLFEKAEITDTKPEFETLPGSYSEDGKVEHLCITLKDKQYDLLLELHYYVYPECDVISRSSKLINKSKESIRLDRLMSLQLDLDQTGLVFTTFGGAWAREMKRTDSLVSSGKHVSASYTGTSSSRANPFVMISTPQTTEDTGACYGMNLIYSGNHYEVLEASGSGKSRFVSGINPASFEYWLEPGASFEAPEGIMSFSHEGFNGLSHHMHDFIREHIVRGSWKYKERPVLLNSWEACYFDINEKKLLSLAKAAKEAGIELFVMDDGWFGARNDDTSSLGDWQVNPKKLPNGLDGLAKKVNDLGLDFGIWVEPEMISVQSKLYEAHPDWSLDIPNKPHAQGRNQRILDLSRKDVQDFIIETMSELFASANISYVKWDMNRTFTDYYSKNLPPNKQGELAHRYVLGLYRVMKELTARFPKILFEGCSAGGNRFDLGILSYFPQIWASDDTDALCRAEIQNNYSYGYPLSVLSAHVSGCPNHQTLRNTPLETRFHIASFGLLGYECNLCDLKKEEFEAIQKQIELYKQYRPLFQKGDFWRGRSFHEYGDGSTLIPSQGNLMEWTCVSKDQKSAIGMIMQKLVSPNNPNLTYHAKGLDPNVCYHFTGRNLKYNIKEFGDLVNTASPIHIRQDSLLHNLAARFIKMDGESEDTYVYGDTLMYAGIKLAQAFAAVGYNEQVRHFPDFASRMYFMQSETNYNEEN